MCDGTFKIGIKRNDLDPELLAYLDSPSPPMLTMPLHKHLNVSYNIKNHKKGCGK